MTEQLIAALGSGGLVGFTLGLLGGGGSILATPLLLYVVGVAQPHVAIGTGALAVAVNALANFIGHAAKGHVRWRCGLVFSAFGVVGAFGGSTLGKALDGSKLLFFFGLVMIAVGALMLRRRPLVEVAPRPVDRRMCVLTAVMALLAGGASGFFGIGGGFLIVPALILATGMPMIDAVGTSLMAVTAFGLATAVNYSLSGLVDWALAGEFIFGGVLGGLVGTLAATRLSAQKNMLNRIFAGLIFCVALYVISRSLGAIAG
ncbi:sulfite exporter TauE/SafE family protein [Rhizobium straminoryzae]|uniref:Probable membrane transporter protein n=1 Tax=Rhizobium straminoryzae TaxID=1387186 RepID=A0A549T9L2_9HYPH|nr:sulfite exporter TauE/SafE family protein [Rhizobium straminoryzae]TRL38561.1 sulfite exporter TauE/SafE family protein [Rhizobium straminoryzae]